MFLRKDGGDVKPAIVGSCNMRAQAVSPHDKSFDIEKGLILIFP
jgi:hypothetical protein